MTDLTKEELHALLKKKEEEEQDTNYCIYKPIRGNQSRCGSKATTPYGFCKKHVKTVQARNIKREWEEKQREEEKQEESSESQKEHEEIAQSKSSQETPKEHEEIAQSKSSQETPKEHEVESKETPKKESVSQPEEPEEIQKIILEPRKPKIRKKKITPNAWNRYEDPETGIVFDPTRSSDRPYAYGVQLKSGSLVGLSPKHIAICKKNNWDFLDILSDDEESESEESEEFEEIESSSEEENNSNSSDDDSDYYVNSGDENSEEDIEDDIEDEEEDEEEEEDSDYEGYF